MCVFYCVDVLRLTICWCRIYSNCCNRVTNAGIVAMANFSSHLFVAFVFGFGWPYFCTWQMFKLKIKRNNWSTQRVCWIKLDLKDLCSFMTDDNALWSVITVFDFPSKYYLNYSTDRTTSNDSNSLTLYRSFDLRNREANATVCQPVVASCSNAEPNLSLQALHLIRFPSED